VYLEILYQGTSPRNNEHVYRSKTVRSISGITFFFLFETVVRNHVDSDRDCSSIKFLFVTHKSLVATVMK
jgi:hypothetical protein